MTEGYWVQTPALDGCKQFASYYVIEKLKIKVVKWGTPKKKKFKKLKKKCGLNHFPNCLRRQLLNELDKIGSH
jgi:hypothetical protein